MLTFYVAIKKDSGFDNALEQQFDTADNDRPLEGQWSEGELTRTTTELADGRMLFKVASDAADVLDRYQDFLETRFPHAADRRPADVARHFNTVTIWSESSYPQGGDPLYPMVYVTKEVLDLYFKLSQAEGDSDYLAKLVEGASDLVRSLTTTPPSGTVSGANEPGDPYLFIPESSLFSLVNALDQGFALVHPQGGTLEDKLAYIYELSGDEGMNLYLRTSQVLAARSPSLGSPIGKDGQGGITKERLTEWLVRQQGSYDGTGYGLNCNDQPFTNAIDPIWGDECTAYEKFGGMDGFVGGQEFYQATAGRATGPIAEVVDNFQRGSQSYTYAFGTIVFDTRLGILGLNNVMLVVRDRRGKMRYNLPMLYTDETFGKLTYARWQMERHPNPNTDLQTAALALIDGCLGFVQGMADNAVTALAVGTTTYDGDVIYTRLDGDSNLIVTTARAQLTEYIEVPYADFDAYIRHLQGETTHGDGATIPPTLTCDDGSFTDAIDTIGIGIDDDECTRYTTLLPPGTVVSRQRLDELYSYSHGNEGVAQVIDHFTQVSRVFTITTLRTDGGLSSTAITIDPVLGLVKYNGTPPATARLSDADHTRFQSLAEQLFASDNYREYGTLLQNALDAARPTTTAE